MTTTGTNVLTSKRVILTIAILSSFITPFMGSSVNVSLPTIGREFSMNAMLLGWIATAYILSAAVFLVPFGRLSDIYGRKKIFIYGMFIDALAALMVALSTTPSMMIFFRALQGMGGAMIFGTSMAMLTSVYPPGERGQALGLSVASVYFGLSVGPVMGGLMTQYLGWRSLFIFNTVIGLIVLAIVLWKLQMEWIEAANERFDLEGALLYGGSLLCTVYGLSELPSIPGGIFIVSGVLLFVLFVVWQLKGKSPLLNVRLFSGNTIFAFSNLAALINYSATFAVGFILSLYLQYIKALSPEQTGLIMFFQPLVMAVFSPAAGKVSDRIEPRIVASGGMALSAFGLGLFIFLDRNTPLQYIVFVLVLIGLGFALFSSPNTNAVMSSVEKKYLGVASSILGTMRLLGQMVSMGIAMLVFALVIGKARITPQNYPQLLTSARIVFAIATVLCMLGVFASLARGKCADQAKYD